jgi:hypothetical protein
MIYGTLEALKVCGVGLCSKLSPFTRLLILDRISSSTFSCIT